MEDLDKSYKSNGFKVPDGYFDQLSQTVNAKLYPSTAKLKVYIGKALSIAASVAVMISIGLLSYKTAQPETIEVSFSQLDSMDIVNYTSSVDISDDELEEIVTEEAVDAIYNAEIMRDQNTNNNIPEEEIEELEKNLTF